MRFIGIGVGKQQASFDAYVKSDISVTKCCLECLAPMEKG